MRNITRTRRRSFVDEPISGLQFNWEPTQDQYVGNAHFTGPHSTLSPFAKREEMKDQIGDRNVFHMCKHMRYKADFTSGNEADGNTVWLDWITDPSSLRSYRSVPRNAVFAACKYEDPGGILSVDAVEKVFTSSELPSTVDIKHDPLDTRFSVWFLLVDIREIYRAIAKIARSKALRYRSNRPAASAFHDANLATQYGILPTIADFRDFIRVLQNWKQAYEKLRDSQDTVHRRTLPGMDATHLLTIPEPSSGVISGFPGLTTVGVQVENAKLWFSRTLRYRFTCPELTSWLARVCQLVDALGILDPIAVWDKIPWSFVVDWFLPIGQWLHRHRIKLLPADIQIVEYGESLKLTYDVRLGVSCLRDNVLGPSAPYATSQRLALLQRTIYVRQRFVPPANIITKPSLNCDVLRWRRVSCAASLIAQRLPRRVR